MSVKFPFFGGGVLGGGGSADFIFMGARIFLISGMFRRSASLAIPHRKSVAAILRISLVRGALCALRARIENISASHESQREISLV